jgi:hypothetical protein
MGFLIPLATWLGANPAALAGLMLSLGIGFGYLSGKVNGWFECNRGIVAATEQARIKSLQRDLDIAKRTSQIDKQLADKLGKQLAKSRKALDEFKTNNDCALSDSDVKRLRHIR